MNDEDLSIDCSRLTSLEIALEKLGDLYSDLTSCFEETVDNDAGMQGFWEQTIEEYLCDYSMQFFLSTSWWKDDEFLRRMPYLVNKLTVNKDLITSRAFEQAVFKMEDLCIELKSEKHRRGLM